ncbi:MAG: thioredoxin domaiN-containing protein [Bacteroidetes bacterium]|nr:MAG: thioredoxin domaiN-containing protein [Bacteroidota bacterium]
MNRFFRPALFLGMMFATVQVNAQEELEFHKEAWSASVKAAGEQNKFILVDAYTDWCGWCKVMDKKTFPDPKVAGYIRGNFYPVKMEMEKEADGRKLSMKYHVNSFPTFLIFNPQGKLVYVSKGYQEPADYLATLEKALASSPDNFAAYNASSLEPGFPDFYVKMFDKTSKTKTEEKTVLDFLNAQTDKTSELAWGVMWRFSSSMAGCGDMLLKHSAQLAEKYGREEVENSIVSVIYFKAGQANKSGDQSKLKEVLAMVDKHLTANQEEYKRGLSMNFFKAQKNWNSYADQVSEMIKKSGYDGKENPVNEAAWTLYEECKDKRILGTAVVWMSNVVQTKPEYMYLDTYAALLYATDNYKDAETWAKKAIDAGKATGEDVSSTESLLQLIRTKR